MAECIVCGNKGLFIRVNAYGRCKDCEYAYQLELKEYKCLEAMRNKALEKERLLKEKDDLKDAAQALSDILVLLAFLDTEIKDYRPLKKRGDLIPIINERIEMCDQYTTLVNKAENCPHFFDALKNFAYSSAKTNDYRLSGVQCGLRNRIEGGYSDPYFMSIRYLLHFASDLKDAWRNEKKAIEKEIKKANTIEKVDK
ncbi:hypothetical protein MCG98_07745 [Ruminococcus sp. OA3]|uniref:hypothetical protein n=1 Tax=Ruminococcus sp. OA3 TaxID=2914164 RepID=UPI001F055AB1|nr:hypothetical protein [Ruminococcus sp. OA3]MCH1982456.1 hypothetical protein [Ruminococcus sp. OA3]